MVNGRFGLYFIAYYIVSPVGKVLFKIHYELDFSDKPQAWEGIKDQYEKTKEGKGNNGS